jgi:hypothetical protein
MNVMFGIRLSPFQGQGPKHKIAEGDAHRYCLGPFRAKNEINPALSLK